MPPPAPPPPTTRSALFGALGAIALLAGLGVGVGAWLDRERAAVLVDGSLPVPPEPPRLIEEDPDYDNCLALLRDDPEGALAFAETWQAAAAGEGEGARHCAALALLAAGEPGRAAEQLEAIALATRAGVAARAAVLGQAAQGWLMAGEAGRAHRVATAALSLTPDDAELLADRARAAAALDRDGEALEDLARILALDPARVEPRVARAVALRRLDRVAEAEQEIAAALQLAPDHAEALLERGIHRQLRGDAAGARADWERAVSLAPDTPTADLAQQNLALNEAGPSRR